MTDNILKKQVERTCDEFIAEVAGRQRKPFLDALKMSFSAVVLGKSTLVKDMSSFLREDQSPLERKRVQELMSHTGGQGWIAVDRGMDDASFIAGVKRKSYKTVVRIKEMTRDVFGNGKPIDETLAEHNMSKVPLASSWDSCACGEDADTLYQWQAEEAAF